MLILTFPDAKFRTRDVKNCLPLEYKSMENKSSPNWFLGWTFGPETKCSKIKYKKVLNFSIFNFWTFYSNFELHFQNNIKFSCLFSLQVGCTKIEFTSSQLGNLVLIYDGYHHIKEKSQNGKAFWICRHRGKKKTTAEWVFLYIFPL